MRKQVKIILVFILITGLFLYFFPTVYQHILHLQKEIIQLIKKEIQKNGENTLYSLGIITFGYGFIHSLGPGHGKTFLSSYILKAKISTWKLLGMSAIIAYFQGFLAFLFIRFVIDIGSQSSMLTFYTLDEKTKILSAGMIVLIGFFSIFFESKKGKGSAKDCWAFSVCVGLCPCPGVMSILLFTNLLGYEAYMAFFTFCTSSGIFLMLSLLSLFAGKCKFLLVQKKSENIHQKFHIIGSILLILIGCYQLFLK